LSNSFLRLATDFLPFQSSRRIEIIGKRFFLGWIPLLQLRMN
jgi:hypothetical protein